MHLLDHPIIAQRYFFPRRQPVPNAHVVQVPGAELHDHCSAPHVDANTVLHFHGNGEVVADWVPDWSGALNTRGLNAYFAEYRGYGGSTGAPALHTMLEDALASADAAAEATGTPLTRTVVYGRSVGSIFALHVAAHRSVGALVIESGIADVLQRLEIRMSPEELGVSATELKHAIHQALDHRAKMNAHAGGVMILHCNDDHLVPVEHGQALAGFAGDRALTHWFDSGDHNSIHAYNGVAILDAVAALAGELPS